VVVAEAAMRVDTISHPHGLIITNAGVPAAARSQKPESNISASCTDVGKQEPKRIVESERVP